MKIELKIGELRMTADGQAVRLHAGEFALTAEEAELAGRMLAALGESLRMQARRGGDAELSKAAGAAPHGDPMAGPRANQTAAVPQALAAPQGAVAPAPQADRSAPRFAIRATGATQGQTEKPSTGNGSPIRLPSRAPAAEARPAAEAVDVVAVARRATADAAGPTHGRRILSSSAQTGAKAGAVPTPKHAETAANAASGSAAQAAPPEVAAAEVATAPAVAPQRRILRPQASPAQELGVAAAEGTPTARRILRPAANPASDVAALASEPPAAPSDTAPRRILRPTADAAASAANQAPPPPTDGGSRRVARPSSPVAAAVAPAPAVAAEGQARRVARPTPAATAASPTQSVAAPAEPRRPGRPRKIPLAAPAEAESGAASSAEAPAKGAKASPGRPRTQRSADQSKDSSRRGPGRPRKVPPVTAPTAEAAQDTPSEPAGEDTDSPAGEPKGRTPRLVDRLDQWMRDNPGPKTREQLLDVSIANGWVSGPDPGRIFSMCMNRERNLFTRMPDGNTEIYLRRAELVPSRTPGKVIRRQGASKAAN